MPSIPSHKRKVLRTWERNRKGGLLAKRVSLAVDSPPQPCPPPAGEGANGPPGAGANGPPGAGANGPPGAPGSVVRLSCAGPPATPSPPPGGGGGGGGEVREGISPPMLRVHILAQRHCLAAARWWQPRARGGT